MQHVIVGAGPAGVVAAEFIRKYDASSTVTVVGDAPTPAEDGVDVAPTPPAPSDTEVERLEAEGVDIMTYFGSTDFGGDGAERARRLIERHARTANVTVYSETGSDADLVLDGHDAIPDAFRVEANL